MPVKADDARELILHLLLDKHAPHRLLEPHHRLQDSGKRAPPFAVHLDDVGEKKLRLLGGDYFVVRITIVKGGVFEQGELISRLHAPGGAFLGADVAEAEWPWYCG